MLKANFTFKIMMIWFYRSRRASQLKFWSTSTTNLKYSTAFMMTSQIKDAFLTYAISAYKDYGNIVGKSLSF